MLLSITGRYGSILVILMSMLKELTDLTGKGVVLTPKNYYMLLSGNSNTILWTSSFQSLESWCSSFSSCSGSVFPSCAETFSNHDVFFCFRLGEVRIGESSIIIAVSSPHRKDSLEAVHFTIDRVKAIVPIFKKEEYENGDAQWKENAECSWSQIH